MADVFKIQNKQMIEWYYETDVVGQSNKHSYIIGKIEEMYNYDSCKLEEISKKLKRIFFPHLKKKMKDCRYDKKEFQRKSTKLLNNHFIVKIRN